MKSIADQLPPEIARQIHPDRRKNEQAYWAVRHQLLDQYRGQWIGFADGTVIASGRSPVTVFRAAEASGRHPFFICVGREEEPTRIRRVTGAYDASYPGEALPLISVEFRQTSGSPGHSRCGGGRERLALGGFAFCAPSPHCPFAIVTFPWLTWTCKLASGRVPTVPTRRVGVDCCVCASGKAFLIVPRLAVASR